MKLMAEAWDAAGLYQVGSPVGDLRGTAGGYVRDPFCSASLANVTNFNTAAARSLLNILPLSRLAPNAVALLNLYPQPTGSALQNNYVVSPVNRTTTDSFDVRFDETFSQKNSASYATAS